jgi:hypothetical protein
VGKVQRIIRGIEHRASFDKLRTGRAWRKTKKLRKARKGNHFVFRIAELQMCDLRCGKKREREQKEAEKLKMSFIREAF